MHKMFLTMEEAAERIGGSVDDIKKMISDGKLQEFKQGEEMMVKSDQIDLLEGTPQASLEGSGIGDKISLEDSFTEVIELDDASASGSAIGLADSNEATGISAFDTAIGKEVQGKDDDINLDSFGSGSQLLDLTRESDDSMAGAELLNQSFEEDDPVEIPASASGIFKRMEEEGGSDNVAASLGRSPLATPVIVEEYDGSGSGLGLGAMVAASLSLIVVGPDRRHDPHRRRKRSRRHDHGQPRPGRCDSSHSPFYPAGCRLRDRPSDRVGPVLCRCA